MSFIKRISWLDFLFVLVCYLVLRFAFGLIIFENDTIETVPYALWMHDPTLFNADIQVQTMVQMFPNERYLIAWVLHFFPNHISLASSIMHGITSWFLLLGMYRVTFRFVPHKALSWLIILCTLGLSYFYNVGGNELYYNMFVSSLVGKAIGVWALYYWIKDRASIASILLAMATLWQPLVGLQLFMIGTGVWIFNAPKNRTSIISWFVPFLSTAGVWVMVMIFQQKHTSSETYVFSDIIYSRIGHHFFLDLQPKSHLIALACVVTWCLFIFYSKNKKIFHFIWVAMAGLLVYYIGVRWNIDMILSLQWMKVTIWIKWFFFISIGIYGYQVNPFKNNYVSAVLCLLGFMLFLYKNQHPHKPFLPKKMYTYIQQKTKQSDVFLVPPEWQNFQAITRRNSYFNFKSMIHHKPQIFEWAERLYQVHGIRITSKRYLPMYDVGQKYLEQTDRLPLDKLDYIVHRNPIESSDFTFVFKADGYYLYQTKK